ncbi:MAG: OsmC family protein [Burkholderiales bacterium]|nr:OsmC family protein [Burkholderiales bacterium]
MTEHIVEVALTQQENYRFTVSFGKDVPSLVADEPPPLGASRGPSPVQLLCAAVGNCLADSLLFAFKKYKQTPEPLKATVSATLGRNAEKRVRVQSMTARLYLGVVGSELEHLDRVLSQFESFCTVTQSVGQGIAISTEVYDAHGERLK